MRQWVNANGGSLAFVVVGLSVLFVITPVGIGLIVVGFVGYVLTRKRIRDQLTWWLGGLPDRLPHSEDEMARHLEEWNEGLTNCLNRHGFLRPDDRRSRRDTPADQVARDCYYGERRTKLVGLLRHSDSEKWTTEDEWIAICASPQTPDEIYAVANFVARRFIEPWRAGQGQP
jgi:hypothetical protein